MKILFNMERTARIALFKLTKETKSKSHFFGISRIVLYEREPLEI